jgi:hypothetical protein
MNRMMAILLSLALVLPAWAAPGDGSKFAFDQGRAQLALALQEGFEETPQDSLTPLEAEQPGRLIPGRALILSAVLPGAGQLYAKNPVMAGVFFALEVGALVGVASYHSKGMNKEDDYKAFAEAHWDYDDLNTNQDYLPFASYLDYEYYAASQFGKDEDPQSEGDNYTGDMQQWSELSWNQKLNYLPQNGFTHEVDPDDMDQQYYEMIGKYDQFGAGWPADGDGPVGGYTAENPYRDSNHDNWRWEADNSYRDAYLNLRKESNDALDMSKNFTMIVLANHLASALHAGFSVSMHNRKMARTQQIEGSLHFEPRRINGERVTMAGLKVRF